MKVLFVAGFGPIAPDVAQSRDLYQGALGLPFQEDGDYLYTAAVEGVKHLAVWPLSQAAQACFGEETWPPDAIRPQAWIEFDVEDIEAATRELEEKGYRLLVRVRTEPWGQTVTRLLGPEGLLVGITVTPLLREP
ncbi:MAG: VOC family protein [Candidatus Dormibacterales bacterium]